MKGSSSCFGEAQQCHFPLKRNLFSTRSTLSSYRRAEQKVQKMGNREGEPLLPVPKPSGPAARQGRTSQDLPLATAASPGAAGKQPDHSTWFVFLISFALLLPAVLQRMTPFALLSSTGAVLSPQHFSLFIFPFNLSRVSSPNRCTTRVLGHIFFSLTQTSKPHKVNT